MDSKTAVSSGGGQTRLGNRLRGQFPQQESTQVILGHAFGDFQSSPLKDLEAARVEPSHYSALTSSGMARAGL